MKLRIKGDTLRLRLTQPEVQQLAETGAVTDAMHLAPGLLLSYGLQTADIDHLQATFEKEKLTVHVPRTWVGPWAGGDGVGFEGTQDAGDGRTLALLVEKDFACLHRRPDEPDAFPNPLADAV